SRSRRARVSRFAKAAARWAPAPLRRLWRNARHHFFGVHRVQAPELQHDEEPEEVLRAPRDEQVLPVLPEAHGAQGDEIELTLNMADGTWHMAKPVVLSRDPCHLSWAICHDSEVNVGQ